MPDIKFDRIVSCSSEDLHHPASNLLKPETYRKWRSEKPGEELVSVIIQLEREQVIHAIDIGNNCSAIIEVLVGKSSTPNAEFEVLLPCSSFMSPAESKSGEQMNRVRMFTCDKFCNDVANKKWDRIKVVCRQPWASHMQYGLSFLSLHSPPQDEPSTSTPPPTSKLGRFLIKDEDEDNIRPGSLFARRKDSTEPSPQKPKTAAAMIAAASSPSSLAAMESSKAKASPISSRAKASPTSHKKREHSTDLPSSGTKQRHDQSASASSNSKTTNKTEVGGSRFSQDNRKALERDTPPPESPSPPPPAALKKRQPMRPMKQLLSSVTFVLSGFQNPLRSELRQKATDLGAKYQGDWGAGCTHLICAFANTPKARQVRGHGKIVKKEWIEHCHREHKYFPWRRYAVDRADQDEDESDEEIWEQAATTKATTPQPAAGTSKHSSSKDSNKQNSKDSNKQSSKELFGADTDDDEDIQLVQPPHKKQRTGVIDAENGADSYEGDTDVDSDGPLLASLPPLPNVFTGMSFSLHEELSSADKQLLKRYIMALNGLVKDDLDDSVRFLVTETSEGLNELETFYPDVKPVRPDWVWKCNDAQKLLPVSEFTLTV